MTTVASDPSVRGSGARGEPARRRIRFRRALERWLGCTLRELIIAAGVSVGVMLAWILVMPIAAPAYSGKSDIVVYIAMAADPKGVHWAPLAFRVLEPWLANAIGGDAHNLLAMRVLSWTAQALTGPAVYLITRRLRGSNGAGLLAVIGLMCVPMWLLLVHQPYLVDGMAMLAMSWTMVALTYGWLIVLPLLLVIMGLSRETVMAFAVPLYMWLRSRWIDWNAAFRVGFMIAPALIVVWAIRQPMTYTGYQSFLGFLYAGVNYVNRDVIQGGRFVDLVAATGIPTPLWFIVYGVAGSLGIWWLLGIVGRRHGGRLWWLLIPVFAQWAFGTDWARYALYAFPVVVPVAAIAVWSHPRRPLLLGLIGLQSVAVFADIYIDGHPRLYAITPSTWISSVLMVITAAVLWWPSRWLPSRTRPSVTSA